jgi:tRNA threonylcarbamoyladenosine biosynthesis protein TsaE
MIEDQIPEERLDVRIKVIDDDVRVFVFTPHGEQYEELCQAVL